MPKFGNLAPGQQPAAGGGGGRNKIPLIVEQKCLVCKSPHRHLIDKMLVAGLTYSEIERQFEFAGIKRRSISNHKDKHLGYEDAAIRHIIEQEAAAAERNFEEGVGRVITKQAYLEVAMQKAYDALIKDDVMVEPKDAVKVIDQLQKLQDAQQGAAVDEMRVQFQVFMQAVKEIVPKDFWNDIVTRTGELLRGSGHTMAFDESNSAKPELVEAEVVS